MKRKGKPALISLVSTLCVLFCGFFAMFLVDGFLNTVGTSTAKINDFFTLHWESIKFMFQSFTPADQVVPNLYWWYSYLAIGFCAVVLILIIVGIVFCVKNKEKLKIFYIIPMLLGAAIVVDGLANLNMYGDGVMAIFKGSAYETIWHVNVPEVAPFTPIWSFIAVILAVIFLVLLFVLYLSYYIL